MAKTQILAPIGYSVTLNQAPGTQLGTLDGSVVAGDFGGATVPVAGTIVAGDPGNATLQTTAESCTGSKQHAAIWLLNVTAAGQSLPNPVPIFVDLTATVPFNAFASASMQLCLPPPPAAAFKIKLLEATLHTVDVFAPPATAGDFRWTAINTPYAADNKPDIFNTTQTQAIEKTPVDATFATKRVKKTRRVKHKTFTDFFYTYSARISGQVEAGGAPVAGTPVDIFAGDAKVGTATTDAQGRYGLTLRLRKTTSYHVVVTRAPDGPLGGDCTPPLPSANLGVDLPCGPLMSSGFTVTTEAKSVVKPKLAHKRVKHKKKRKR
jgi:hypothetical protein